MPGTYTTPGVYVSEDSGLPSPVVQVDSALPVFIGYTQYQGTIEQPLNRIETAVDDEPVNITEPVKVNSLAEYVRLFGSAPLQKFNVEVRETSVSGVSKYKIDVTDSQPQKLSLYYHLKLYFANGGGACFIISIGTFDQSITAEYYIKGLDAASKISGVTLLVMPQAYELGQTQYEVYKTALLQAATLQDRFVIIAVADMTDLKADALSFRNQIGNDNLKWGAAYYPSLITTIKYHYNFLEVKPVIIYKKGNRRNTKATNIDYNQLDDSIKQLIYAAINKLTLTMPSSAAIAGVYCTVDATLGVWKAPANIALHSVNELTVNMVDAQQEKFNVDVSEGKSINVIRKFTGKGIVVWGARTLAGNDNEWRYLNVRRFFINVEQSLKQALQQFVFEANEIVTWQKVRFIIENFLVLLWRQGALQGIKPEQAFYVKAGLGATMTQDDILNGLMIVEIGMSVIRPAEFIIVRIEQIVQHPKLK